MGGENSKCVLCVLEAKESKQTTLVSYLFRIVLARLGSLGQVIQAR